MPALAVESATLLCMHPFGAMSKDPLQFSTLIVGGLELPGQPALLHPNPAALLPDPSVGAEFMRVELRWPPEMLARLGAVYLKQYVDRSVTDWNCHTFGAEMTGQRHKMKPDDMLMPKGTIVTGYRDVNDLENTVLYGVFEADDPSPWHSFVGTHLPDRAMQVTSLCGAICFVSGDAATFHHPGRPRSYVYP